MSERTYRVIQWAIGVVGKTALRHFIEKPVIELVGVYVTNPEKVGKGADDIAGLGRTGVMATNDADKIIALTADCMLFSPIRQDLDMVCRLLRSGKNVVCPTGPFSRPSGIAPNSTQSRRRAATAEHHITAAASTRVFQAICCRSRWHA